MILEIISIIGVFLSLYSFYVEKKTAANHSYKPACDIRGNVSCSKAFSSKYGRIFGISNSVIGIVFYLIIFVLSLIEQINFVFYFSILGFFGSIYLAYISYFKMRNFCLICTAIYLINLLLLIFSYSGLN